MMAALRYTFNNLHSNFAWEVEGTRVMAASCHTFNNLQMRHRLGSEKAAIAGKRKKRYPLQ